MIGFPPKKSFNLADTHPRPILHAAATDPHAAPPRLPDMLPSGFVPMDVLLRDMGLAPAQTSKRLDQTVAPLVAPHATDIAEFSPPRPLRRPPTRFAPTVQTSDTD
ncbi:MAG: hypothetical protein JXQ84_06970 [Rhodospirillaceae bacterium]|nr:hypothetical protein [Rhodospirillaceae bacterium]